MATAWTAMAWGSGAFHSRSNVWVVKVGDLVDDGFADQKKFATVDGLDVAYIDIGEGPPLILLHGCPFSSYEWREIIPILAKTDRLDAEVLARMGAALALQPDPPRDEAVDRLAMLVARRP